jgi:hypothetical protein
MVALRQGEDEPQDPRPLATGLPSALHNPRQSALWPGEKIVRPNKRPVEGPIREPRPKPRRPSGDGGNGANNQRKLPLASTLGRRQGLRAPLIAVRLGQEGSAAINGTPETATTPATI